MDRQQTKKIAEAAEKALAAVAEEFGVQVVGKGGTFLDGSCILKFEFAEVSADGVVNNKEADDFKHYAGRYGLEAEDLGAEFTIGVHTYKIVGCKPRSSKYPIICERDGKRYKLPALDVATAMEKARADA